MLGEIFVVKVTSSIEHFEINQHPDAQLLSPHRIVRSADLCTREKRSKFPKRKFQSPRRLASQLVVIQGKRFSGGTFASGHRFAGGAPKPTPGFRDIGGAEATKGANTKSQKEEMSGVGFLAAVKTFTPGGRRRRRCEKQQKVLELPPGYAMQPDVVPCWDAAPPITPPAAFLPPGYKKGFPGEPIFLASSSSRKGRGL
ncbi:hypothetical protein K0M31_011495 [Melipona bicolor]|uniref:Uncharacterized protein n=1 Tax=Melipona bicolor TaxID=60889 RepID=A0AA40KUN9_9HYME|nr:hypothetical protein K0M31_011495 [Melipona bicolor]